MSEQPQTKQQRADDDLALLHADRTRRSRIAIIAFFLSLITVVPMAGTIAGTMWGPSKIIPVGLAAGGVAFMAVILGVVGIFRTRKRRRRGRALAILAIVLGIIGTVGQPFFGFAFKMMQDGMNISSAAIRVLGKPRDELPTDANAWYDKFASNDFRARVKPEQFTAWLESTIAQHGQLQSFERTRDFRKPKGIHQAFRYTGRFVNGSVIIETVISFQSGKPLVDNMFVNDKSPRD